MTQPASVGVLSRVAIGTANPPTVAFEYQGEFGLHKQQEIINTDGLRGTHDHPVERTALGKLICSGPVVIQPGPKDLDTLLPLITGTVKNGSNEFINASGLLNETLIPFFVVVDRIAQVYTYAGATSSAAGCYVDSAELHIGEGEPLSLTLAIEAINEYPAAAGTFPAGAAFNYQSPYTWSECTLTIGGVTYQFKEATIRWNNNLKKDRFMNSAIRTDLPFLDRIVECELLTPNTSDQAALLAYPGITAEAFSLVATQGSDSLTIASSALQIEPISPALHARDESLIPIRGRFHSASGGTVPSVTITNIST